MNEWDLTRAGLVAAAATAAVMPLTLRLIGKVSRPDVPNERSSHTLVTPRGGGLACLVGAAAGIVAIGDADRTLVLAGVTTVMFAALGFADDVRPITPRVRLLGQAACALSALVWAADIAPAGFAGVLFCVGAMVALVGFTNAFNFMDGINGISGLHVGVYCAIAATTAWRVSSPLLAAGAVAVGASGIAFLPFNLRKRPVVFLGDVGSYLFGAGVMSIVLLAWRGGATLEAAGAALVIYLADTMFTMTRRALRGDDVLAAHREHVYQRLAPAGTPHGRVSVVVAGMSALAGLLGATTLDASVEQRVAADLGIAAVTIAYLCMPYLAARRRIGFSAA